MDSRTTPFNGRVAASALRGQVEAEIFCDGTQANVIAALTDIRRAPDGPRLRQLLLGDAVTVYDTDQGYSYVQSTKDGYCGYVSSAALGPATEPTHWVHARATHVYTDANIKSADTMLLSLGVRVTAKDEKNGFLEIGTGYVPKQHLTPIGQMAQNPLDVARQFLGAPYLWGGNSSTGLDCSALVQTAYLNCGLPCPGDSDLQCAELGTPVDIGSPFQSGDLLFWTGHVALALSPDTMIHATAHPMAVVTENIQAALDRINAQGDGPLIAHKRPE
jgi:Bacterial dipeptidyl-peptidase Sh3 domain/NlpC/P60 family